MITIGKKLSSEIDKKPLPRLKYYIDGKEWKTSIPRPVEEVKHNVFSDLEKTVTKIGVGIAVGVVTGGIAGGAVLYGTQATTALPLVTASNVGICAGVGGAVAGSTVGHKIAHRGVDDVTIKEVLDTGAVAGAIGGAVAGAAISIHGIMTSEIPQATSIPGVLVPNEDKKPKPGPKDEDEKPDSKQDSPPPKDESHCPPKTDSKQESTCSDKNESSFPKEDLDQDEVDQKIMNYIMLWQDISDFDKDY